MEGSMVKIKSFLLIVLMVTILACASQGNLTRLSKLKSTANLIVPSYISSSELKKIKKIAVFVTSSYAPYASIIEELLSIKLRELGFEVPERRYVERLTVEELIKHERLIEKNKEQKPKILNIIDIGKKLELDAVIVGNLIEARQQLRLAKQEGVIERIVVSTLHLQVVSILTGKTMMLITLDYQMGRDIDDAVDDAVKVIKTQMQ